MTLKLKTTQHSLCNVLYPSWTQTVLFWALAGRFGNSWPCQKPPNHLLRETKGRNRILNEPFEHHVKLFKRRKPFTGLLIKNMFIMTRHGKWAQTKEKKSIVLYIKYGRCIYSFSLSKKGRVDMCVNIHTCDTAVFFHSFYNTATQSHCAGLTRDLCTFVLHADAEHYNHCYLKYAGS